MHEWTRRAWLRAAAAAPVSLAASAARPLRARQPAPVQAYGDGTLPAGIRSRLVTGVNGITMHVLDAGYEAPGRPGLLLVHGFPELGYSWRNVMLPLADAGYHVMAPDQRGYGRSGGKNFFSIHSKMQSQNLSFEQIYDLIAFRIILDTVPHCYEALGLIHSIWKPIDYKFKDYIGRPKPNIYQSLHTTVIGPVDERIEIQIRAWEDGSCGQVRDRRPLELQGGPSRRRKHQHEIRLDPAHGREPGNLSGPRRIFGKRAPRSLSGRGLRLYAQGGYPRPAEGIHAGGLRLPHPHGGRP